MTVAAAADNSMSPRPSRPDASSGHRPDAFRTGLMSRSPESRIMGVVVGVYGASRAGAIVAVSIAAVAGLIHAGVNLYWASGGTGFGGPFDEALWDANRARPVLAAIGIMAVLAAIIPIPTVLIKHPSVLFWRALCWVGAAFLVIYGIANLLVSEIFTTGIALQPTHPGSSRYVEGDGSFGPLILTGHATVWDILFIVWGVSLLIALFLTRTHGLHQNRPPITSDAHRTPKKRPKNKQPQMEDRSKLIDINPPWNWFK